MTTERLERLSVLQELTVAALALFEPSKSVDLFLERVAERLGCTAALWLVSTDARVSLLGAAGLSQLSRAEELPTVHGPIDWAAVPLPYPELARTTVARWAFDLAPVDARHGRHGLLLCIDEGAKVSPQLRPMVDRLVEVLRAALSHRQLIGDLRESYEALARAQHALLQRERLAAVGELAAVVAHEVRNPLGSILNCLRTLERQAPRTGDEAELLKIAKDEAAQIERIVTDLLDFAKPGELSLKRQAVGQVVASGVEAAQRAQAWPGASVVTLDVAPGLEEARVDADLLRQAVINLVTNGLQAMPRGGPMTVRLTSEGPWLRLDVEDAGVGIPPEVRARIFEPFFSTRASGSGLGLAIVRRIVDAHDGTLEVQSEPGRGATFTVRLPRDGAQKSRS